MTAIKRRDTQIELRVRKLLYAKGYRYRVDFAPLNPRRRADIVFTRKRIAVFMDGCFWHGCPEHYVRPKTNTSYWSPKVAGNIARDLETTQALIEAGWLVLRFWAHEDPGVVVGAIEDVLRDADTRPPRNRAAGGPQRG